MSKYLVIAPAILVVLVAAILAASGFRGRPVSMVCHTYGQHLLSTHFFVINLQGIDLGTTYSAIVFTISGEIHVAKPDTGRSSLQSVVAIVDGKFVVGRQAYAVAGENTSSRFTDNQGTTSRRYSGAADHPWSAVFDSKRVIGRNVLDEFAAAESLRHGGRIVPHPFVQRNRFGKATPRYKWPTCDGCQHDLAFVLREPPGSPRGTLTSLGSHSCVDADSVISTADLLGFLHSEGYASWNRTGLEIALQGGPREERLLLLTPQAVACLVVRALVESGRVLNAFPTSAVAAVPADFNVLQREATLEAYARAGVRVGRLLYEPAAAAVAYGLHKDASVKHVLVFDMGGGTTDVSILYLQAGAFTLIGSAGDGHLGGEDFDDCVLESLQADAEAAQGGPLITGSETHGVCSHAWLKQQAESVKVRLSGHDGHDGTEAQEETSAEWWCWGTHGRNVTGALSVADFESRCNALFLESMGPVKEALARANVDPEEVDEIVLVGGSSRLPYVRRLLRETLHRKQLRSTVDPDLAVALGAAMVND